ncbi:fumarylacetoacetate hydrolase family protein [Paramicrobacterium fandaimingii]|uniref:fumarylacetoacetate hydrolase family protein n=1 Tax=Paramicrobacterium fandaimingii TaxID=2708079 RepID=UPI00141DBA01|nr:fumarylacetoacetate hydrolase family protein [Microbacterium fandaimingii]
MRIVSFTLDGSPRWGVVDGDRVLAAPASMPSLKRALREHGLDVLRQAVEPYPTTAVTILTPVPDADKILCVGLNYLDHIAETGRETPAHPVVFARFADSLVGNHASLIAPRESVSFDFEGELAVVIGRTGRRIAAERAHDYILGYSILNDGSIRDFQKQTHQYTPGKNFDASGAFGPVIVTPDEIGELAGHRITTTLNDDVVQQSDLGQLCFDVPELIARISTWTTLRPGDVIATGTPGGIGAARDPQLWMFPGDRIEVSIDGIGTLSNPVVEDDDQIAV